MCKYLLLFLNKSTCQHYKHKIIIVNSKNYVVSKLVVLSMILQFSTLDLNFKTFIQQKECNRKVML